MNSYTAITTEQATSTTTTTEAACGGGGHLQYSGMMGALCNLCIAVAVILVALIVVATCTTACRYVRTKLFARKPSEEISSMCVCVCACMYMYVHAHARVYICL